MIQIIQMASRYNQKPSEILKITNDLLAFMIDEFSMYLEMELMDKEGVIRWNELHTTGKIKEEARPKTKNGNQAMIDHIEKYKTKPRATVKVGE